MSIQEHLNKIRNAIYGREVRESIAKGIETAYDDASENGNANMEVKIARGANPNLNTRLNKMDETDKQTTKKIDSNYQEVTAQLAQTDSKKVDKDGSGQVKWANIAQDAREQISGDKVAIVGDNSIITTNLTNNAVKTSKIGKEEVTPATTSFIKKSTNLLDRDNVIADKVILNDGSIVDSSNYVYSHRIDVLPGQTLFTRYVTDLAFYDQDDNFISRPFVQYVANGFTVVPENCYYVRANITKTNYNNRDLQLSISDTEVPYEPFREELDNIMVNTNNIIGQFGSSALADDSITEQKVRFINASTNLLDAENLIEGKVILSDGTISENNQYYYSHRIEVLPGQTLFARYITNFAWYDQNDNFISRPVIGVDDISSTFTEVPTDTYYARVNITKNSYSDSNGELQVSVSDIEIPYEPYYRVMENMSVNASNIIGQFGSSALADDSITEQKVRFIKNSSNLLNKGNVFSGSILADGSISDRDDYYYSHRIDVLPGQTLFTRNLVNLAFYNSNDLFLSRVAFTPTEIPSTFTVVPADAYYVRGNIQKMRYDSPEIHDLQISISEDEVPYEPHYVTMDNFQPPTPHLLYFKTDDQYVINGKVDGVYQNSVQLAGYENVETDWLPEKIYQKFDELVSDYPNYVRKNTLGKDSSGLFDVNMYHFKPQNVPTLNQVKRPKMILMAGNHGYEKTHPYVLYLVMKKLCEEWRTDELLETLRWNVEFIIIPCSNPSSFATNSRTNANGVDISRNFEPSWERSGYENKGPYPLSEPEAQYIDNVLQAHHEDTIFFTSLHNFSSSSDVEATVNKPNEFIWVPACDKLQEHISQELVSRMTRLWKRKYEWLPQDEDLYLGYVDRKTPNGLEGLQANLYGITASTYEISRIFQLEDDPVNSNGQVITMGVEGLVNLLLLNLKVGVDYYNRNKKVVKE